MPASVLCILVEKGKIGARRSTYGGEREREQIELYVIRVDLCVPVEAFIRPSDFGRVKRTCTPSIAKYWGFKTVK